MSDARNLAENFIHLGLGGTAISEPAFGGMDWYEGYGERHAEDGAEGRLVSWHAFTENWDAWEMHPEGAEVVLCIEGEMTLHQEHRDGRTDSVTIGRGEYAINPPGTWHTADVKEHAAAVFITSGEGTEHRPR